MLTESSTSFQNWDKIQEGVVNMLVNDFESSIKTRENG